MSKWIMLILVCAAYVPSFSQIDTYESTPIDVRVDRSALVLKSKKTGAIEVFFEGELVRYKAKGEVKMGLIEEIGNDYVYIGTDEVHFASLKSMTRYSEKEENKNPVNEPGAEISARQGGQFKPYISLASNIAFDWSDRRSAFNFRGNRTFIIASAAILTAAVVTEIVKARKAAREISGQQTFMMKHYDITSVVKE